MKDIEGYEGLYAVTRDGKIWSYPKIKGRHNGCFLAEGTTQNGYKLVVLHKDKKRKTMTIHRIVAEAYIEKTNNKATVNHINGIKSDNDISNLEWSTLSEQQIHARSLGLNKISDKHRNSAKEVCKRRRVLTLNKAYEIRKLYRSCDISIAEISIKYNVHRKVISNIVNNKTYID